MNHSTRRSAIANTVVALALLAVAGTAGAAEITNPAVAQSSAPAGTPTAMAARAQRWNFAVTPYAWLTDTGLDVKVQDRQVVDTTIPVSDLLEDLDTIVQLRAEAQRGSFGIALDLFDVTLSDDANGIALPENAGTANVSADFGMTILDLAGFYDVTRGRQGLVFMFGTRVLDERATLDATLIPTSGSSVDHAIDENDTMVDGLFGLRMRNRLVGRFSYAMQADLSTGGTDLTWSVGPSLNYHFGDMGRHAITAGYRRMTVDFADENGVDSKMTLSGVLVGLRTSL